jgi:uncharacterized protein YbcI
LYVWADAVIKVTRGTIEAQVANAVVQFQREQHGRGPSDVRVTLVGDLVLVRSAGIFTATESHLIATEVGRRLIKSARQELRAIVRNDLESLIARMTGCQVIRSYGDVDVGAAEQMEVFVLDTDLEKRLLRQDLDVLNGFGKR